MRRVYAAAVAMVGAYALLTVHVVSGCFPLCVMYTPDNPEWYLFFCYLC